jgi:hypothetical protein
LVNPVFGQLDRTGISSQERLKATIWITFFQAASGVAKDFMKLTGKSTPKLVTKEGQEGRLFRLIAWLTGVVIDICCTEYKTYVFRIQLQLLLFCVSMAPLQA